MTRFRLLLAALLIAVAAISAPPVLAQAHAPAAAAEAAASPAHEAEPAEAHGSWAPVLAKAFNFAILATALIYFLRAPMMGYLNGRIEKVREDLVTATQTRETAVRQLAEIDARLSALPAELEALKTRGAEDIVAERARIEQDAQTERQRVLDYTRREIDMRLRIAKRELLELGADLAVAAAAERIKTTITPADQTRLVDRYASQIQGGRS